jgi:hypothetical protein
MRACIHVCKHVCIPGGNGNTRSVYTWIYVYMCVYVYLAGRAQSRSTYIMHVCIHTCVYVDIHVCMYLQLAGSNIYIYIYIYTYINTCIPGKQRHNPVTILICASGSHLHSVGRRPGTGIHVHFPPPLVYLLTSVLEGGGSSHGSGGEKTKLLHESKRSERPSMIISP